MEQPRILLVEDEFLIRMTLAEALADSGYTVEEAGSADEALALAQPDRHFALVITDIQLPGRMNGLALVQALRDGQPELPVIYVTGRPETMGRTQTSERDVFVAKPYLPSQISKICRSLIGV